MNSLPRIPLITVLGKKRKVYEVDFTPSSRDLGWLNYTRALMARNFGIGYKRTDCLRLLDLPDLPGKKDHLHVANDICRVVKGLIEQE